MRERLFDRREVLRLIRTERAQLVEVLLRGPYEEAHLPGAVHIPLHDLDVLAPRQLDAQRPVVVYGADALCDLSSRAAARLRQLGFGRVYDYVPGKADWLAAGLPREGRSAATPLAGDLADRNAPVCTVEQPVEDAVDMLDETGRATAAVVDHEDIVVGLLSHEEAAAADGIGSVGELLHPAPATVRADTPLAPLLDRMTRAHTDVVPVTDPEGRLLGLLARDRLEQAVVRADSAAR
jgi:rhodanese-related sulfurtransferase/CBS domain-containing protein